MILLDEVEKAHPDVFNILLQVLDDGQLTDGQGRRVDFKNTVLVMTSNLGSDVIQTMFADQPYEAMRDAVMEIVGGHFRPEFINRIDEAVVFHPLQKEQIRGIADIQLDLLRGRLAERELTLELNEAALDQLVEVGYDPVYGARPLKRAIQRRIENPLAQSILAGEFPPGQSYRCAGRKRAAGIQTPVTGDHGPLSPAMLQRRRAFLYTAGLFLPQTTPRRLCHVTPCCFFCHCSAQCLHDGTGTVAASAHESDQPLRRPGRCHG